MKSTKRAEPTALVLADRGTRCQRIAALLGAMVTLAGVVACVALASGHPGANTPSAFVREIPSGYRDWKLISVAHEAGTLNDLRAILGNDLAVQACREGTLPFPDGAIIARVAWEYLPSEENNQVFGRRQSFVAGRPTNGVQFMIKDSKKYAATGGWGFAHFDDGKPASDAFMQSCFPCHDAVKTRDLVFTRYSP